jgi:hypothetical protein
MLCAKMGRQIAKRRPSGFGICCLWNKFLKTGMSASPDQNSSASTSRVNSGLRSVAIFHLTCASVPGCHLHLYVLSPNRWRRLSPQHLYPGQRTGPSWQKNTRSSFRVAIDLPFNVFAHARLIALLVHQYMVRAFATRFMAGATAAVPTDSVCADAFPGAIRPTFRNRRGGSRGKCFPYVPWF